MRNTNIFEDVVAVTIIETVLQNKIYDMWQILQNNRIAKEMTIVYKVSDFTKNINDYMEKYLSEEVAKEIAVNESEVMEVVCERCEKIVTGTKVEYNGNINGIFKLTVEKL